MNINFIHVDIKFKMACLKISTVFAIVVQIGVSIASECNNDELCAIANCSAPAAPKLCPRECSKKVKLFSVLILVRKTKNSINKLRALDTQFLFYSRPKMLCRFWLCCRCLGKCNIPLGP